MGDGRSQPADFRASPAAPDTSTVLAPLNSAIDLGQVAAGRAHIYRLLRDILNELPSATSLRAFVHSPFLDAAVAEDRAGQKALTSLRHVAIGNSDDSPETAAIALERTRLLRGIRPGQGLPPACESAYLPDTDAGDGAAAMGRAWTSLLDWYRRDAFVPDRALPPDFLGNELAYLAHLSGLEAAAWQRDDRRSALAAAAVQQAFLQTHLGRWIGALVERVAGAAAGAFWPGLVALVEAYSRLEQEYLSGLLDGAGPDSAQTGFT